MNRDKIPIFDKLTWLPYNFFLKIRENRVKSDEYDFSKYQISKKIKISLPENDEGLSKQISVFGFREPLNCRYFVDFVSEDDKVLEIGANVGFFALLGGRADRIICIEPLMATIPFLTTNLIQNGLMEKSVIMNAAVGKPGKLFLEVCDQLNLSRIVTAKNERTLEIPSISLEELNAPHNANFIRMDVEGYEYEILMNNIPKSITKISIELHTGILGRKKSEELLSYLAKEGFKIQYLIDELPLRLYPFLSVFKGWFPMNLVTSTKRDLEIQNSYEHIFTGRSLKYLFLVR